jgi:hypothetical protein
LRQRIDSRHEQAIAASVPAVRDEPVRAEPTGPISYEHVSI